MEAARSWVFPLPLEGDLTIGRDPEAALKLWDELVSRNHARLEITGDEIRITDLRSRHGTSVNGRPITGSPRLHSGDVIGIGAAHLILHRPDPPLCHATLPDTCAVRRRLAEDLERARRDRRVVSTAIIVSRVILEPPRVLAAARQRLRSLDTIALVSERELAVVIPELDLDGATEIVEDLLAALPSSHAGIAASPEDGVDAEALLAWARRAAARTDGVTWARDVRKVFRVEDREVHVAEPALERTFDLVRRLAPREVSVLILGEPGVGKQLLARMLHAQSPRASRPLAVIACAAAGREPFARDLARVRDGAMTLYLDDLAALPPPEQKELAGALSSDDRAVIASTTRAIEPDLHARFAASLVVPPLRQRPSDLAVLIRRVFATAWARYERPAPRLTIPANHALLVHAWPGNVAELEGVAAHAARAAHGASEVDLEHLPVDIVAAAARAEPAGRRGPLAFRPIDDEVRELERTRMLQALAATDGVRNRAAELIRMPLRTFVSKLKRYSITSDD